MSPRVLAQFGRRELLHELGRLPELDLEDDGEVAVAAQTLEVQTGDAPKAIERIRGRGERGACLGDRIAHHPLEDRDEQIVLAMEVEIYGTGGDARHACHVGDLRAEEAALGEHADGRAEDEIALVRPRRGPRQRSTAGHRAGGRATGRQRGAAGEDGARHGH